MYTQAEVKWGPYQVVRYFQEALNKAGNPIRFTEESGMPRQRSHAKRLIAACKGNRAEVEALIQEFVRDEWEVKHNPCLARVLARADVLRAAVEVRQREEAQCQQFRPPDLL